MHFPPQKPPSTFLFAIALAGLVLAVGATKVLDLDIWWHLKTGELIWLWHEIPRYDIYSYTAQGRPWLNPEWLYQVLVWNLYHKFGIASLTCLKLALTAGIAFISFRTLLVLSGSRSASLWGTLFLLWAIAGRIQDRPHLFSMLFTAIFSLRLHRFITGRTRHLWDLPLIEILWINLHAGAVMGPLIIFACALGEGLQSRLRTLLSKINPSEAGGPPPISPEHRRHLWLIGLACTAASLVSPNGIDTHLFSIGHMGMEAILSYTWEWLPVFAPAFDEDIPHILFGFILVATLISYVINRQNARLSHLMLTMLTSELVLKGMRFMPDFAIINLPIIFFNVRPLATCIKLPAARSYVWQWTNLLLVALISLMAVKYGVPATTGGNKLGPLGFGTVEQLAPSDMVDFLDENDIHGRGLNDMGLGGYLIFRRWPHDQVFIDGRTPVYGDDFYRRFVDAFQLSRNFEELDRQWHFDYLVFKAAEAWNLSHFHKYIWENPNWQLIYANPLSGLVYLRNDPKFREKLKKLALKRHPLIEEMKREEAGKKVSGENSNNSSKVKGQR